ncbi:MAG TPA: GNAT family N-acetyltransferase [Thermoanaerobaculia bacterium]
MEIRALREGDERSQFQSGAPELDRFFHQFAGQNQFKHHVGVTYVAVDRGRICGFATIAPGHVEIEDLPVTARRKLPRYPLPVVRLARLAIDESAQGQGVGAQLLRFVLKLAVRLAADYGCIGVVVDAKPDAIAFYSKYGFIAVDTVEGQSDARPQPAAMFLSMSAIKAAVGE